jgi:hypothetical protein
VSGGHQSRRRRSYARRQHEVRERDSGRATREWLTHDADWQSFLPGTSNDEQNREGPPRQVRS